MAYVESPAQARQVARSLMAKGADLLKVYQNLTWEELKAVTEEAHKVDVAVVGHTNNLWEAVKNGLDGVTHLWPVALSLMSPENLKAHEENRIACPYAWMEWEKMDDLVALLVQNGTYVNTCLINEHTGVLPQAQDRRRDQTEPYRQ